MSAVSTPPPTTTARRDAEATKAAILRAARYLLARTPHADITLKAVAERAGVSPPLIVKYFGNKDALFARVMSFESDATALLDAPWTNWAVTWSAMSSPARSNEAPTPAPDRLRPRPGRTR